MCIRDRYQRRVRGGKPGHGMEPKPDSFPGHGSFTSRVATLDDIPELTSLMRRSIKRLLQPYLPPAAVEASFEVMGVDSQLVVDGTYMVVEEAGQVVGCGGWSWRTTPFGGDHSLGRDDAALDPQAEPARIRAMYTDPEHTRRGIGRLVIALCEEAAMDAGFRSFELTATPAGVPLYEACGYQVTRQWTHISTDGVELPMARMNKGGVLHDVADVHECER
eukprot:TRINITY_DN13996_c0_g1_i2.p1 TRINITY_DN13996_c0_g1~~TRINITY_DN13996_c0_g1_i2.p1  ORF type:complete len:220 (+),score=34.01 TRINITY_DN13996_c0_g1_i2:151-810(+)